MSFRAASDRAKQALARYDRPSIVWKLARRSTLVATGMFTKLMLAAYKTKVHNWSILLEAFRTSKIEGRGLLTVMNHVSVVDEPLVWGNLPFAHFLFLDGLRWTLGAENICFKNKFLATYFSLGQVLSTQRFGSGPFQDSIDCAVELLSPEAPYSAHTFGSPSTGGPEDGKAKWVHIFPETYVHQPLAPYANTLRYFHWGVSRMVLEATRPPMIVPIFTHGLEKAWPEDRSKFSSFFRGMGSKIEFNVGLPLEDQAIGSFRQRWLDLIDRDPEADLSKDMTENLRTGSEAESLRSELAKFIRDGVLRTKLELGFPSEDKRFESHEFWALPEEESGVKVLLQDDIREKLQRTHKSSNIHKEL